jgi:hypothetical protein
MLHRRSVVYAVLLLLGAAGQALAQAPGAPSTPYGASPGPTSFDDACARAKQRGTPVLLEFYTEW